MNSFVSNHLQTVAFTHAASFPLKLSPGFPVMHFSNALSANVLMTVWTIICCLRAREKYCMSPSPAADVVRGSSPTEEAKLLSEEEKEERSSLVKSLESWDLFSDERDQNGIMICDRNGRFKMKANGRC
jgi:hypothetical protein